MKTLLIITVAFILISLLTLLAIYTYFTNKKQKVELNRVNIKSLLNNNLSKDYTVYSNCIFNYGNSVLKIDHLVVSKYGVFVINTHDIVAKSIEGLDKDVYLFTRKGREKNRIYNPLHTCIDNTDKLAYLMHLTDKSREELVFKRIVSFTDNINFKIKISYNKPTKKTFFTHHQDLVKLIGQFKVVCFDSDELINVKCLIENKLEKM